MTETTMRDQLTAFGLSMFHCPERIYLLSNFRAWVQPPEKRGQIARVDADDGGTDADNQNRETGRDGSEPTDVVFVPVFVAAHGTTVNGAVMPRP